MRHYFVSDIHLGIPDSEKSLEREKKLCRWLDFAAKDATAIYLMGDVFDFWFEYRTAVPRGFTRLLGKIADITDSGIPVYMFKGNHDMWMFGYLEKECGVITVSDELELDINGKKLFLHHGDGLGPGENGYKFLRRFFRSSFCQWLFARLHPNFGIGLALMLSRRSRLAQKGRYETYTGDDKEFLVQYCLQKLKSGHIDYFIFGHRHLPLQMNIGQSQYTNLGEWLHNPHYAVFDGSTVQLNQWE